ncbi:MAG: histidine phosphatase family protein, partial [Pseudomonadota bacterium]
MTYFAADGTPIPPNDVPLNNEGIEQATAAGHLFAQHGVCFDRVIVSGLPRTVQTAECVIDIIGQQQVLEIRPQLEEIRSGKLSAIPVEDLRTSFTKVLDGTATLDTRFLGGETLGAMLDRVLPEIDRLRADNTWSTLLMVLHGGVNRGILSYLLSGERRLLGGFEQSPACINVLDVGDEKRDVVLRSTNL